MPFYLPQSFTVASQILSLYFEPYSSFEKNEISFKEEKKRVVMATECMKVCWSSSQGFCAIV